MKEENNSGITTSFWQLLSRYAIEIPSIQRDYVQGRGDEQSTSARTTMLDDIQAHLEQQTPMSLNFIYGKVTQGENCDKFVPIDGQQRLTTLYLIHWLALVAAVTKNPDDEYTLNNGAKILGKFSYQTRQTSSDFFLQLSKPENIKEAATWMVNQHSQATLSNHLQDKKWFRPDFMFDPTVNSVLNVLDDIKERFAQQDNLWPTLISGVCPIQFSWLDVNDIDNDDDLYIKMNARGKQLSDFENIKAELEKKAQALLHSDEFEAFCRKFDQEWTDFFWSFKGTLPIEKRPQYDTRFMNFLNWFLWNQWATQASNQINTDYSMTGVSLSNTRYRSLDAYNKDLKLNECSDYYKQTLIRLERILDYVSGDNPIQNILEIVEKTSKDDNVTYNTRMLLEAATAYLDGVRRKGLQPEEQSWNAWIRVIRHLSDAAAMWQGYNTLGLYAKAVGMVEQYANHAEDLTAYLATFPGIEGFTPSDQIEEEEIKAWLLVNAPQWSESLHHAETIPYFEGKIGFLLDFAGVTKENIKESAQNPEVLSIFNKYLALTDIMFNKQNTEKPEPDTELLINVRRALLTKGKYSMDHHSISSYLVDNGEYARYIGWRSMLRNSSKKNLLRRLYDDILNRIGDKQPNRQNIIDTLTAIADEYVWDDKHDDNYAKPLIQHKGLWSHDYFGKLWQFRIEDDICYLPLRDNTRVRGENRELSSCVICEKLKHDIPTLRYELGTRKGRLYRESKPSEPNYLTLSNADVTVHVGRKYISASNGTDESFKPPVITVSYGEHEEQFPDTDSAISYIKTIFK